MLQPGQAVCLVWAQLRLEAGGQHRGLRLYLPPVLQGGAEFAVAVLQPLLQQCVYQGGLLPTYADFLALQLADLGQGGEILQPFLRQQTIGAVIKPDAVLSSAHGLQQGRQGDALSVKLQAGIDFQPVHAGALHQGFFLFGLAIGFAGGIDMPVLHHQAMHCQVQSAGQ